MHITRYNFGESMSLNLTTSGGVAYWRNNKYWLLGDDKREVPSSEIVYGARPDEQTPFERSDFGDRDRLVWPAGACAIAQDTKILSWSQRYGMWTEAASTVLADATRAELVRIGIPIDIRTYSSLLIHDDTMWLTLATGVMVLPVRELEALFACTSGSVEVHVHEHYPNHRPEAKARRFVKYILRDSVALESDDGVWTSTRLPVLPGLVEGLPITLYDELMKDVYLEYEHAGQPRRPIYDKPFPTDFAGHVEVRVEPAVDPAGNVVKASGAARIADLERVFGILADDPADEAARLVVVDLLEDAGEPYAAQLAKLLAGETADAVRRDALGVLVNYLDAIEWHGRLPRSATLSATAPLDDELGDVVAADYRLGFFHTLRLGEGSYRLYSKLIASPRAAGLRHVDGSRAQILTALITANRRELRRLSGVKFAQREVIEALADPTFDRVYEIETETQARVAGGLLDYITRDEAKFFARAPRHLLLVEKAGRDEGLVDAVLAAWPRLPLERLTFGGVTLARDGTATAAPAANDVICQQVAARFRFA